MTLNDLEGDEGSFCLTFCFYADMSLYCILWLSETNSAKTTIGGKNIAQHKVFADVCRGTRIS